MSGPCLSSSVPDHPLRPGTRRCLGEPLPHQQADRPRANPAAAAEATFTLAGPWSINPPFGGLFSTAGHVTHVLRTRAPLGISKVNSENPPFDLHVLNTPPAFVLSQNQTLRKKRKHHISMMFKKLIGPRSHPNPEGSANSNRAKQDLISPPVHGARFNLFMFHPDSCRLRKTHFKPIASDLFSVLSEPQASGPVL